MIPRRPTPKPFAMTIGIFILIVVLQLSGPQKKEPPPPIILEPMARELAWNHGAPTSALYQELEQRMGQCTSDWPRIEPRLFHMQGYVLTWKVDREGDHPVLVEPSLEVVLTDGTSYSESVLTSCVTAGLEGINVSDFHPDEDQVVVNMEVESPLLQELLAIATDNEQLAQRGLDPSTYAALVQQVNGALDAAADPPR